MSLEQDAGGLKDIDASPGDAVSIKLQDEAYSGILMPRSGQGDAESIVLKLESGYNIGIDSERVESVEVFEEAGHSKKNNDGNVPENDSELDIAVLHTGGTIASRVSYAEGGVKPGFEAEDLLEMYPELFDEASIETDVIAQMLSEDMEPAHWQAIAETAASYRDKDGIIIGHGTDTMHFTASALSFMLENIDVPVVLVGAQRSSDRPSSDAAMNLVSAVEFIKEGIPGVYICMHAASSDTEAAIHRGTRARKLHTSRRDAFRTVGDQPFAVVDYEEKEVEVHGEEPVLDGEFECRNELETDVGLFKTAPGTTPDQLQPYEGIEGLVLEGTGLGHAPVNSFDQHTAHHEDLLGRIGSVADDGVVVMTSQCIDGTVNMNVYDAGVKLKQAGVIEAADMVPETAYVKLMWCLGQEESKEEAVQLFKQDIAGEMQGRRSYEDTL